tara:strand:- start:2468 stop:3232 length:765 start_codon:yes stop_codon:yes gene_type:complete
MKVLVTGHNGFIGSHVYSHLIELGFDVTGIDFPIDIGNFAEYSDLYNPKFDVVIHLAAFAALRDSIQNPDKFWENNVVKSQPVFDYCKENNVRLLYASSAGVYGWWMNPYAITKKVNEIQAPPDSVGMRFFNVWAENDSRSDMLYRMLQENTATYLTRHRRDWIHVNDVVSAICCLIPSNHTGPIDIGTGRTTSVLELGRAMGRGNLPINEDTPGEPDSLCADTRELYKLGWCPTINIMDVVQNNASSELAPPQ